MNLNLNDPTSPRLGARCAFHPKAFFLVGVPPPPPGMFNRRSCSPHSLLAAYLRFLRVRATYSFHYTPDSRTMDVKPPSSYGPLPLESLFVGAFLERDTALRYAR